MSEIPHTRYRSWAWFVPATPPGDQHTLRASHWSGPWKTTFILLFSFPKGLLIFLLGGIIGSAVAAGAVRIVGNVVADFYQHDEVIRLLGALLGVILMAGTAYYLEVLSLAFSQLGHARLVHSLRAYLMDKLLLSGNLSVTPGRILSTMDKDSTTVSALKQALEFPIAMLGYVIGVVIALLPIHWGVSLGVVLAVGALTLISIGTSSPVARRMKEFRDIESSSIGLATDYSQGVRVIKGLGATNKALNKFESCVRDARDAELKKIRALALTNTVRQGTAVIGSGLLVTWCALLAQSGEISTGEFLSVAMLIPPSIVASGLSLSFFVGSLSMAVASSERIMELNHALLSSTSEEQHGSENLKVHSGLSVWLTDHSEAQKRVQEFTQKILRKYPNNALLSPHNAHIFEGTVAENIDPEKCLSHETLYEILSICECQDIVKRIGGDIHGFILGEGGFNLSGGQRQRLALARPIAANPDVLILDEPTTGLDAITLDKVCANIKQYRDTKATIVLTTSRAWCIVADRVESFK